ncbi:MAG: ankyrin repeat domain-containing protein [Candidatus Babeliales bacterium]
MSKVSTWGMLALTLSLSCSTLGMDYIPKALKSGRLWGAVAVATVISGAIYYLEYWQDAPNRDLFQGVCEGDYNKVALALYDGADHLRRAKDGSTLLHYAVRRGHRDIVHLLTAASLPGRPLINIADVAGNTPLYYAVEKNDASMVKLLILSGACKECTSDVRMTQELEEKIEKLAYT